MNEKLKATHVECVASLAAQNASDDEIPTTVEMWLRLSGALKNLNLAADGNAEL